MQIENIHDWLLVRPIAHQVLAAHVEYISMVYAHVKNNLKKPR